MSWNLAAAVDELEPAGHFAGPTAVESGSGRVGSRTLSAALLTLCRVVRSPRCAEPRILHPNVRRPLYCSAALLTSSLSAHAHRLIFDRHPVIEVGGVGRASSSVGEPAVSEVSRSVSLVQYRLVKKNLFQPHHCITYIGYFSV